MNCQWQFIRRQTPGRAERLGWGFSPTVCNRNADVARIRLALTSILPRTRRRKFKVMHVQTVGAGPPSGVGFGPEPSFGGVGVPGLIQSSGGGGRRPSMIGSIWRTSMVS